MEKRALNRVSEPKLFNLANDSHLLELESPTPESAEIYYTMWRRQRSELIALKFLVIMQLLGIFVLSITIGCLLFRGY